MALSRLAPLSRPSPLTPWTLASTAATEWISPRAEERKVWVSRPNPMYELELMRDISLEADEHETYGLFNGTNEWHSTPNDAMRPFLGQRLKPRSSSRVRLSYVRMDRASHTKRIRRIVED